MAKLNRLTAKIFGETASTTNTPKEIGQFGSAKAGTYNATGDVATIQSLPAWSNGWIDAVTPTDQFPPLPEMTGVHKVLSYQNAYLLQQGIPEWDSATTYYENNFCTYNGIIYRSILDENTNNQPNEASRAWFEYGSGDYANQDINNLTTFGNARLQYAPFAINAGTVINGNNHTLQSGSFIQSYTEAGTYTIEIIEAGNYEIEMYGAGGGRRGSYYTPSGAPYNVETCGTGGSGAGFKGVLNLPIGTYTISVGEGGISKAWNEGGSATNGGATTLTGIITAGGGTAGNASGSSATAGQGGTVAIIDNSKIVSTQLNASGNNGTTGSRIMDSPVIYGGVSVYDNTHSGYGAGAGSTSVTESTAKDGYFKITKLTGDASKIFCDPCTITTCDGRTKAFDTASSITISSEGMVEVPFVQPTMTSNGTMGGDTFAVAAKSQRFAAYNAINGETWAGDGNSSSQTSWYAFYNPEPIKVTQVTWYNNHTTEYNIYGGTFEGSNDNTNWTTLGTIDNNYNANALRTITIDNPSYYNYYRWNITRIITNSANNTTSDGYMRNIKITAVYNQSASDGNYYIFKEYKTGALLLVDDFTISKTDPLTSYWLDISTTPANLKINGEINNDLVYIGDCTISNSSVAALTNRYFNACPYHRDIVESYQNGTSWYAVYSDGWCEQGGYIPTQTRNDNYPITLLKQYIDTNYQLLTVKSIVTNVTSGLAAQSLYTKNKTVSGFTTAIDLNVECYWKTSGYIN